MKVSIIIPVYNGEKYLNSAISSALAQDYPNFEIIIVNDASTDSTNQICLKAADDPKIRVFTHDKNRGTAAALNTGIKNAKGEWIKWLSADDVLFPHYLKTMMAEIANTEFPESCIFYTHYGFIGPNGEDEGVHIEENRNDMPQAWQKRMMLEKFFGNASTSLIHKFVFEEVGLFDETVPYSEDYEFWLRATCLHKIRMRLVPQVLVGYRLHDGQLSRHVDGSIDHYLRDKTRLAMQAKQYQPINILLARGSPRELPDVEAEWPNMPCDMIIAKWIREWDAYQHMLKFFKNNPQYTHLAVASDDIVVKAEHIEKLQATLQRIDYPVLSGIMNVEEDDLDTIATTPPNNVPHIFWPKREFRWLKRSQTNGNIIRVGFSGFQLSIFRRDIIERFGFDSDGPDNGMNMWNCGSLDVVLGWKCHQSNIPIYADTSCFMLHQRRRQKHIRDDNKAHMIFWPSGGKPITLRAKHLHPLPDDKI